MTQRRMPRAAATIAAALLASAGCAEAQLPSEPVRSQAASFRVTVFARGLERPWGAAFLPDGRLLVTERPGRVRVVARDGQVSPPLGGVPQVEVGGQGGLLDLAPAPDFSTTREIYLCHSALVQGGALTRLVRARLSADGSSLEGARAILDATPPQAQGRNHFGCRIAFGLPGSPDDGKLYLTTGDRFIDKMRAQRLNDLAGKVLRLERDGRPAEGNPWPDRPDVRPEIWSYGHRNPQGLAFNPWTGSLWSAEFGPRGGDEVNVIRRGGNYGWPLVTAGRDYDGSVISERAEAPGMESPIHGWTPVVSPSGIAFYTGDAFPGWRQSLFLAALNPPGLVRLSTDGDRVTGEERLLWRSARMRHVLQGPDGFLYVLTDGAQGRILRLEPA
jgi:glucose/arabinose dehydrogenase